MGKNVKRRELTFILM